MASSGELIRRRSEYYAFRENIRDLASKIKMAADEFYTPVEIISENFTINDEPGDGYKLRNYQRELDNIEQYEEDYAHGGSPDTEKAYHTLEYLAQMKNWFNTNKRRQQP